MTLWTRLLLLRAQIIVAREARRWRREIARDLSAYDTQADRDDLLAAFDRYGDTETRVFRDILARQSVRDRPGPWPAMGRY
jgi:hypothetical protein